MTTKLLRVSTAELEAFIQNSSTLEQHLYSDTSQHDSRWVSLEKAWAGILYLLLDQHTGDTNHPLEKVLFSGQLIDEAQNLGYGPAHYLTPGQVSEINGQLSTITVSDLRQNYHPEHMTQQGIYPFIWEEGDSAFEYLSHFVSTLQQCYAAAASNGEAIISVVI